ncbi:MAG: hypothetical protein EU517_01015 [Promethearchaeota archaeon]|nr:MAG: hypothetical protein EU517_01015 [Candidatus Lokiarchaeota archaeon]
MSDDINEVKEKLKLIDECFSGFTNFIELKDFRSYLLFTLNAQVPSNILAQMGFGGSKDVINLPYNPAANAYYHKIGMMSGALIVYVKNEPLTDEFILEKDDPLFKKYLNTNEIDLAFRGKEKFIFPKIVECSSIEDDPTLTVQVDDMFSSFESFMALTEPNVVFVLEGNDKPDIIFAFNLMPQLPTKLDKKVLKIDVFLDEEHLTKDKIYLKREEDYKLKFLKDIKEVSHTDLYKSSFSLLVHVKSFNNPY